MEKFVLVIIDMQPLFESALNLDTIKACRREICIAIKNQCPIIFVECSNSVYGKTIYPLKNLVEDYNQAYFVDKWQNDGSHEIAELIRSIRKNSLKLRVCGVNVDVCLFDTVIGLREDFGKEIEIVADATNASSGKNEVMKTCRTLRQYGMRIVRKKYYERIHNERN